MNILESGILKLERKIYINIEIIINLQKKILKWIFRPLRLKTLGFSLINIIGIEQSIIKIIQYRENIILFACKVHTCQLLHPE